MSMLFLSVVCSAFLIQGCAAGSSAGTVGSASLPASHPASAQAAEAPISSEELPLAVTASDSSKPAKRTVPVAPASADTMYTCPMDPQVLQREPGKCPICGMKLVKKVMQKDSTAKSEPARDTAASPAGHESHHHH
jgi:hypothetical protein